MKSKAVTRRQLAETDIQQAADYYNEQGGLELELRFIRAVESATRHIASFPASGSNRYADLLKIPGLRMWPIRRFPYLIFYVERADRVDVWRVLHGARDIPKWLLSEAET